MEKEPKSYRYWDHCSIAMYSTSESPVEWELKVDGSIYRTLVKSYRDMHNNVLVTKVLIVKELNRKNKYIVEYREKPSGDRNMLIYRLRTDFANYTTVPGEIVLYIPKQIRVGGKVVKPVPMFMNTIRMITELVKSGSICYRRHRDIADIVIEKLLETIKDDIRYLSSLLFGINLEADWGGSIKASMELFSKLLEENDS